MRINWDEVADYTPVPKDEYEFEVCEVIEETSNNGDEYWRVKLEIIEGKYEGRRVTDKIFFTEKALPRAKMIWNRFGLETKGIKDEKPEKLLGRRCLIAVEIGEYEDENGNKKPINVIPFAGYKGLKGIKESLPTSNRKEQEAAKDEDEDDIPF